MVRMKFLFTIFYLSVNAPLEKLIIKMTTFKVTKVAFQHFERNFGVYPPKCPTLGRSLGTIDILRRNRVVRFSHSICSPPPPISSYQRTSYS